jgi:hypothetical protein
MQQAAVGALLQLASNTANAATIAAAGAIPPVVQLLQPGNPAKVRQYAAALLARLRDINAATSAAIDAAGATEDALYDAFYSGPIP